MVLRWNLWCCRLQFAAVRAPTQRGQSNERKTIERLEAELRNMEKDRSFLRDEMRGMADVARLAEQVRFV